MITKSGFTRIFAIIIAVLLTACGQYEQKDRKPSADWSRSLVVGQHVAGSPGFLVEGQGERIHMAWVQEVEDQYSLQYLQLNQNAEPVQAAERIVPGIIKAPRLIPGSVGQYHLIWAGRTPGDKTWDLWHLLLGETADLQAEPTHLSAAEANVGKYAVAADGQGGVVLAWDKGQVGDITWMRLDANGRSQQPPQILTHEGETPALQVDKNGQVHLIWHHDKYIYYVGGDAATLPTNTPTVVVDLRQGGTIENIGDSLQGPALGLTDDWVYVLWSVLNESDTDAVRGSPGTGQTSFAAFPIGQPALTAIQPINTLTLEQPPVLAYEGNLTLSQLSPALTLAQAAREVGQVETFQSFNHGDWADLGSVSQFMLNPAAMTGQGQELVVALATSQDYGLDEHMQIATAVFADGQYQGYSVASKTKRISDQPTVAVDAAGNIHLIWREGAGGQDLYYATTAPITKASLDHYGLSDLTTVGLEMMMQAVVSMALLPLVSLWWIFGGLVVLLLWSAVSKSDKSWSLWLPILAAFLVYNLVKVLFLPSLTTYVPFSAWVYISDKVALPLQLGIPLLIVMVALWVAHRVQRRHDGSLMRPYIALVITDALFTLAIYGVTLQGAI